MKLCVAVLYLFILSCSVPSEANFDNVPRLNELDNSPQLINRVPVFYPDEARIQGISGNVDVEVIVDFDGTPYKVRATPESHPLLAESSIEAVKQYQFEPGFINGFPTRFYLQIPLRFRLNN